MGLYTQITRRWLERRFARRNADDSYFAHMPIYGAGQPGTEDGHLARLARMFRLLRILDGLAAETLLDVGGAEGYLAHLATTIFGTRAASCDLSAQACQRARELFGLPVAAIDSTRLPFPDDAFDVVVCSEVIEHVEHPIALVLELLRIAAKTVIVTTEELHFDRAYLDDYLFKRPGWPHMERNLFHPDDFAVLLPGATLAPQCDTAPPRDCDGRDAARRWLLANTRTDAVATGRLGVIAIQHLDEAATRPRRHGDGQLLDLLLSSTVEPGTRHPEADAPLASWFAELLPGDSNAQWPKGVVPDLVDLTLPDPDHAEIARRLERLGGPPRPELLSLHDRLHLPDRWTQDHFDFRHYEDRRGFWPNDELQPRPDGAGFAWWSTGGDPWVLTPCLNRPLRALELELRVHNPDLPLAQGTGQVFWKGPDDETVGEDRSVSFPVPNDGAVHTHCVELAQHPQFPDVVQWLRLDLVDGPCEVDFLSLRLI